MKKPSHVLEYPIVMKQVLDSFTVSVPDIALWTALPLPVKDDTNKFYVTSKSFKYKNEEIPKGTKYNELLGRIILNLYAETSTHIRKKKWVPKASDIKAVVTKQEKPLTLPAFTKLIRQVVPISQDTVRRDIERGVIKCAKTTGGHRRIPGSEVGRYLAYLEGKIALKQNKSLGEAMKAVERSLHSPKKKV